MSDGLPRLFFDRPLPEEYCGLLDGRAIACGPDDVDLATADGVVAGATRPWNAAAFALGPRLKVVSRTGVGYDNVDVDAARVAGVVACYAPGAPSVSTAEHTVALILAVTKRLRALHADAMAGKVGGAALGLELDGSTLGLVGLGRIARRVALAGQALGMTVVAYDPYVIDGSVEGVSMVGLDQLLAVSDVVSLHAPATPDTQGLFGAATLATMKRGAYLINCARGGLVDQSALLDALNSGQIAGAGLDVTEPEPLPAGHPLLVHPNVLVTPHMASSTVAGRRRLYEQGIDNALAVIAGRPASVVPGY